MIEITDKAAQEIQRASEGQTYLRLRVLGAGCSGFEHKLSLETECDEEKDVIFEVNGIKVVVDKRSILYVEGATIDFHEDLNLRGFLVKNPNAKTTCGCGKSFSF
jgi:iron-sulfur cluster assembly protein